jgi:protein SCO1/2
LRQRRAVAAIFGTALAAWAAAAGPARAQLLEDAPEPLEGVGIDEKLDAPLPLELTFRDETGGTVTLGRYFGQGRPVALCFVYFDCPMLCNVFLDGFTATLREMDWTPGREFEVVTVSMDPRDTPEGAVAKRAHYVESLGKPGAMEGWHFLTGEEAAIRRLADAAGFRYRFDEETGEFQHSAGVFLTTPDGRISRVLYGVMFQPQTLRLSLVEASDGRIGSPMDQVLLFCFAYDHTEGRYGPAAMKIMRAGGALTMLAVAVFLVAYWKRDSRRGHGPTLGAHS